LLYNKDRIFKNLDILVKVLYPYLI